MLPGHGGTLYFSGTKAGGMAAGTGREAYEAQMMDAQLVMFKSDGARRDFPIAKSTIVIGRKTDCDLRIPLSSVSRHHCELTLDADEQQVKLRDLGSSNGTYHNNERVQEAVLAPGDEITVGPVVFTLVVDGQPQDIEPVRTVIEQDAHESGAEVVHESGVAPSALAADTKGDADDDEALTLSNEEESHSPTVDLDDPIEALQRLSETEGEQGQSSSDIFPVDDDDERRD